MIRLVSFSRAAACAALIALLALGGMTRQSAAQGVTVAPPVVVLDHRSRGGSIELFNPAPTPVEVSISLLYGIPESDAAGNVSLRTFDQPPAGEPAATGWIDVYPKRVVILPGQRQTVRFLARPPADLPDREYWTRIVVASKGAAVALNNQDSSKTSATLNVEIRTITTLLYRKGPLATTLVQTNLRTERRGDSLLVRVKLEPRGNAAWLGTANGRLIGADGKTFVIFDRPMGIYRPIDPSFAIPTDSLPPGRYRLLLELKSERQDLARSTIVQSATVRDSLVVDIPPRRP